MSTPPDLLATVEAAARIGCERSTLSRWVKEGRITPAMRLPGPTGAFLFTAEEVARVAEVERAALLRREPSDGEAIEAAG